ncbi:MAG: citrate/2-methylcitrate synthase [Anaerolineae bacterium]|nr:citrate/2-methylcitrate synthase [Anaerolineae bacterium]
MSSRGLEGVVATESAISAITDGRLVYRGIPVETAVNEGSFAEVAWLLWHGRLPTQAQLGHLEDHLASAGELPRDVVTRLRGLPPTTPMLVALREGVGALALTPQSLNLQSSNLQSSSLQSSSLQSSNPHSSAVRLVGALPAIAAQFYHVAEGRPLFAPRVSGSLAARFLHAVRGEVPPPQEARALDQALILYADHELNASTFAARVVASTLADMYSAVIAALCTLKGPLHGGATAEVWRFLASIESPADAASRVDAALEAGQRIPGFGHRVYRGPDPRALVFRQLAARVGGQQRWLPTADAVAEAVYARKGLYPNTDLYSVVFLQALEFDIELATAVFALGRMAGWTAHILEQYANNRLIRPRAQYTGPEAAEWTPIGQRG